jgi:hypothetical protein
MSQYEVKELVLRIHQRVALIKIFNASGFLLAGFGAILFVIYSLANEPYLEIFSQDAPYILILTFFGLIFIITGAFLVLGKWIAIDNIQKIIIISWGIIIPFVKRVYHLTDFDEVFITAMATDIIKEVEKADVGDFSPSYTVVLKSKIKNIQLYLFNTEVHSEAKDVAKIVNEFLK